MKCDVSLVKRLTRPYGMIDVVLDTDAYNEIDDQFAISYLLRASEKVALKAIYAAPFFNAKSSGPADGMERSYWEIEKVLHLAGRPDLFEHTYRGSTVYLPDESTPVPSPAASHLATLATAYTPDAPLYVVAIGAITNIASALLINPAIRDNIVIVWLGGNALHWPHGREFNLQQDIAAARVVFDSGAAVVQLPCSGVVDQLRTTEPELKHWLVGKNPLCTYLAENTIKEANSYAAGKPWSRVIWDIAPVLWLLDTNHKIVQDYLTASPIFEYDHSTATNPMRHAICYVWSIDRDAAFLDLFSRLS